MCKHIILLLSSYKLELIKYITLGSSIKFKEMFILANEAQIMFFFFFQMKVKFYATMTLNLIEKLNVL